MNEVEEEIALDLEEIGQKYETRGFFRRLGDMFKGLGRPHDTREYKIARIELQRLMAPLIAILTVSMFVVVLIVVTAVSGQKKDVIEVHISDVPDDDAPIEETPEEPPDDIEPPPEDIEITIDTVDPGPVSDITPMPSPPSQDVSVKPAPQDTVAFVDSPVKMKSMTGSRNPGSIGAATKGGAGWGDATTEACVLKVLWWLKATQQKDGSWDGTALAKKHKKSTSNHDRLANTAFAVLTYLAHGEYPGSPSPYAKDFGPVVKSAVDYIVGKLDMTGKTAHFPVEKSGNHEYEFLIATYALCEAYGMTKYPNCKDAALACMERIIKGQNRDGGWDYNMNPQGPKDDLSYGGWAIQALKAGKMAGLHPDGLDECIKKAINCVRTKNYDSAGKHQGSFTYNQNARYHRGLTATGCLAMQLLGYGGQPEVRQSLDYMKDWYPSFEKFKDTSIDKDCQCPQYYCYYAAQCKFQAGMKEGAKKEDVELWQKWNADMKKTYPKLMIDVPEKVNDWTGKGHAQGYFVNDDQWTSPPVMDSCLTALQLMVYYRYLPTSSIKAGQEDAEKSVEDVLDSDDVGVSVDI